MRRARQILRGFRGEELGHLPFVHRIAVIFSSAAACAGFNGSGCDGRMCSRAYGSRSEISGRSQPGRDLRVCGRWRRWFRPVRPVPQRHFAPFLDDVPDFLLALGQLRKFAAHRQRADKQPFAPAGFLLAHGFGQDGFQRGFRRAAIVLGNPAREFQDLRRDERLRADDFENGFEIGVRRFLGERGDAAENFARAERHLHAAAHLDLPRQSGRNQIIELLAERDFKADAGDHGGKS
jgi:hypothetical protein